ncbi:uncharacterized protein [Haliotis cracherodii]|uniref:uncharacterized protein isoform X2 n=1 Tax=Haliotis cracherodii TaxID=6455 RepID=UPI0039EC9CFC
MGLSGHVCLPVVRCMGLVVLLTGTQHCFFAATTVTGITPTTDTTPINDVTDVTDVTHIIATTSTTSTAPSTAATSTTAATTTAPRPETTSDPNHFFINLNTSCVTGQLKVNLSFFNDTQGTINITGTCDGDTQYVKDSINLLTKNQTITTTATTTTAPSTTTTSTDGTTASPTTSTTSDHSAESCGNNCTKYQWSGIGIGAGAVVLPCLVSLLLYVFRRRICSSCRRRKESDDAAGTGRTESDTSGQRPRAGMNPYTTTCFNSLEETDVSRSGYGNTGFEASTFEGIPALPRKTSVFSIHEDDEDSRGNSFNGFFVPEPNQAPESDYDQLPIGRKPLETTATDAGEDDEEGMKADYMNVLEARGAHHQAEKKEYINYPAISC